MYIIHPCGKFNINSVNCISVVKVTCSCFFKIPFVLFLFSVWCSSLYLKLRSINVIAHVCMHLLCSLSLSAGRDAWPSGAGGAGLCKPWTHHSTGHHSGLLTGSGSTGCAVHSNSGVQKEAM